MSGFMIGPDPPVKELGLSGAIFLYFDPPYSVPVALGVARLESSALVRLVKQRHPPWEGVFWELCTAQHRLMSEVAGFRKVLEPLEPLAGRHRLLHGPLDLPTLDDAAAIATSGGLTLDDIYRLANHDVAALDVLNYLNIQAFAACGNNPAALYRYCGEYLRSRPFPHLLAEAYVSRLRLQGEQPLDQPFVLSGARAERLLAGIPVSATATLPEIQKHREAAWEIFREVLRPYLEPITAESAERVARLLDQRHQEVARLRAKSIELAERLSECASRQELHVELSQLLRSEVDEEIGALLDLDRVARQKLVQRLVSDKSRWSTLATSIFEALTGNHLAALGTALAGLASIPAVVFSEARAKNERIDSSDYALVYRLKDLARS